MLSDQLLNVSTLDTKYLVAHNSKFQLFASIKIFNHWHKGNVLIGELQEYCIQIIIF